MRVSYTQQFKLSPQGQHSQPPGISPLGVLLPHGVTIHARFGLGSGVARTCAGGGDDDLGRSLSRTSWARLCLPVSLRLCGSEASLLLSRWPHGHVWCHRRHPRGDPMPLCLLRLGLEFLALAVCSHVYANLGKLGLGKFTTLCGQAQQ